MRRPADMFVGATWMLLTILTVSVVYAAFNPKGVSHHNLIEVTETASPTPAARDRPLMMFTDPDGNKLVLIWVDATRTLAVVTAAAGATVTTSSTTTTVTTT